MAENWKDSKLSGCSFRSLGAQEEFKIREDSQIVFPAETSFVLGFFQLDRPASGPSNYTATSH